MGWEPQVLREPQVLPTPGAAGIKRSETKIEIKTKSAFISRWIKMHQTSAASRKNRSHRSDSDPWRAASSIRPGLGIDEAPVRSTARRYKIVSPCSLHVQSTISVRDRTSGNQTNKRNTGRSCGLIGVDAECRSTFQTVSQTTRVTSLRGSDTVRLVRAKTSTDQPTSSSGVRGGRSS